MALPERAFGYITASSTNVGDAFQAIAARSFLPAGALPVDRELIAEFEHDAPVNVIVSGWFMHERGASYELSITPPERAWPPSPPIEPFFVSLHLTGTFRATVFSEPSVEYLRAHAPVGARDLDTLAALRDHDVPSYFSGCLTLTLRRPPLPRGEVVYLVDLDASSVDHIRGRTRSPVALLTHGKPALPFLAPEHRLRYAEYVLGLYASARCVVTTRLHAALPCLAFQTPVLFLSSQTAGWANPRFSGLVEHLRHGSVEELLADELAYDVDDPPANPTSHQRLRENLSRAVTDWVASTSAGGDGGG